MTLLIELLDRGITPPCPLHSTHWISLIAPYSPGSPLFCIDLDRHKSEEPLGLEMARLCLVLVLICLTGCVCAQQDCEAEANLDFLDQMIDAQLHSSCYTKVELMERKQLSEYCFNRGVIKVLWTLFDHLKFKEGSDSFKNITQLKKVYNKHDICMNDKTEDIQLSDISACLRATDLSPVQILKTFKEYFTILLHFKPNKEYDKECEVLYDNCSIEAVSLSEGPSPKTLSISSTYSQNSKSDLSEINSSSNKSSVLFTTTSFTENMSDSYSQSPHQSSKGTDIPSLVLTNMPAEVQPMTPIMDHVASTEHLDLTPETPIINTEMAINGEAFPKGRTESTYTMSLSPIRAYHPYFNTESSNTDGLQTKKRPTTTEVSKANAFSQLNGEITSARKITGEVDKSTEFDIVSTNSVAVIQKFYSEPSMEHDIDTSSSTITKMRRSVVNVDDSSRAYLTTHAQLFLPTDGSASNAPHLTSPHASIPSNFESLQTIPQEKPSDTRNLGWSSYLNSAITTKTVSHKLAVSSLGSGIQSPLSEASQPPAYKGGYMYSTQQQEQYIGFITEDRKDRVAGPTHGSNPLPIIETEKYNDGRKKEHGQNNLYLVMVPSILSIVFLCGLLYIVYRYRILKRQLNRERVLWLPEQRPLHIELQDM